MANRLKKKTPPQPSPEELNPDKEPEVTVSEVVKDERTTKIFGASSLLLTIFLFVAFTSYLFTWQEDQDKVHQFGIRIFATDDVKVNNLLGVLGAYVAHTLFYKGFGLASYLLCSFFFVLGTNLLFGKKIFSLARNLRYMIVGLIVLSMAFAFVASASTFSWGGGVGELLNAWFVKWIGNIGTGALLLLSVFSYIIWRFNPTFKVPDWQFGKPIATAHEDDFKLSIDDEVVVRQEWNENVDITEEPIEEKKKVSPNKLKSEGSGVVVIMPQQEEEMDPMNEFEMNEKNLNEEDVEEEDEEVLFEEEVFSKPEPLINVIQPAHKKTGVDTAGLELEINETPEEDDEPVPPGKLNTQYDVTLDLKDYKYPGLDLLETHGSEKIVHDPTELETNKNQIIATLKNYDIAIQRIAATVGPTVTLYEIVPAPGVRISRIKNLEDDIALSLAALGIRIIAPIPGKGTIGIEVPNVRKTVVSMKTLLASEKFQSNSFSLPIAIGKKIDNENFIVDLTSMPHLLMAGATGQGKSVGLNAILVSLLYKKHPS